MNEGDIKDLIKNQPILPPLNSDSKSGSALWLIALITVP